MRNYVQSSARPCFRIANAGFVITLGLGIAANCTSGNKQLALGLATIAMGTYATCMRRYAYNFNDKLTAELSPEIREIQEKINNNKLFIW